VGAAQLACDTAWIFLIGQTFLSDIKANSHCRPDGGATTVVIAAVVRAATSGLQWEIA